MMKDLAWDPLAGAVVFGLLAGLLYFREEAPRWCGFFAAAAVVFLTAGVTPLLHLAHHHLAPGLDALIIMGGVVGAVLIGLAEQRPSGGDHYQPAAHLHYR